MHYKYTLGTLYNSEHFDVSKWWNFRQQSFLVSTIRRPFILMHCFRFRRMYRKFVVHAKQKFLPVKKIVAA